MLDLAEATPLCMCQLWRRGYQPSGRPPGHLRRGRRAQRRAAGQTLQDTRAIVADLHHAGPGGTLVALDELPRRALADALRDLMDVQPQAHLGAEILARPFSNRRAA
jgi:hypothetical protein